MKLKAPETVFSSAGFCPGCGHGLATRLIGEVSEELGIQEKNAGSRGRCLLLVQH